MAWASRGHDESFDSQPEAVTAATSEGINGDLDVDEVGLDNLNGGFSCNLCIYAGRSDTDLAKHKRDFHGIPIQNSFKCSYCRVAFPYRDRLLVHLQKHTGSGSFDCYVCARKFASEQNLLRHVKTVHGTVEYFCCHLCPRKFTRKDNLLAHTRKHRTRVVRS
ncbi:hypothetical protein HPB50_026082 [Hyalomma asiaticum]|uniref:Uncharacterized protein n=1 Tax=Hyalomma asiaticum TaxID=266040 RepID=A0ACB7RPH3_HYAAI|nr:hypothetical protein HPB50_026082 [Hyalomma asiaticum]